MKHVVIVGGGVIGLCCAYSLVKRDYNVTVIDSGEIGEGASAGNAGWVTPSLSAPVPAPGIVGQSFRWMFRSDSPLYVQPTLNPRRIAWLLALWRNCNAFSYIAGLEATARLNMDTFHLFDELEAQGIEFEHHKSGLMFCFLDEGNHEHVLDRGSGTLDFLFMFSAGSGNLGGNPRLASNWIADFRRLYDFREAGRDNLAMPEAKFNRAMRIDTTLVNPLRRLPGFPAAEANLAFRNLTRARMVKLATGQQMAMFLKNKGVTLTRLTKAQIRRGNNGARLDGLTQPQRNALVANTPLWFYILREAELNGG